MVKLSGSRDKDRIVWGVGFGLRLVLSQTSKKPSDYRILHPCKLNDNNSYHIKKTLGKVWVGCWLVVLIICLPGSCDTIDTVNSHFYSNPLASCVKKINRLVFKLWIKVVNFVIIIHSRTACPILILMLFSNFLDIYNDLLISFFKKVIDNFEIEHDIVFTSVYLLTLFSTIYSLYFNMFTHFIFKLNLYINVTFQIISRYLRFINKMHIPAKG